jgi:molybdopterin-guanine dinucleotide biosynthesis protein A
VNASPRLLGAVLAGGASRRFGRDKASEVLEGLTLVERAARTLSAVCETVVVVTAPGRALEWPTIPDLRPGCGPLAGIEAALQRARSEGLDGAFVLACDLPLVTPATIRAVAYALDNVEAAAPAREGVPSVEPLCAAYRTSCAPLVARLLDGGERAAHALFDGVAGVRVELAGDLFVNVNTAADAARARRALGAARHPPADAPPTVGRKP